MELKMEQETVFTVEYTDFNDWVNDRYADSPYMKEVAEKNANKEFTWQRDEGYHFVSDMESGNDQDHRITVNGTLSQFDQDELDTWKETGKGNMLAWAILEEAAHVGDISTGTYLIRVSW